MAKTLYNGRTIDEVQTLVDSGSEVTVAQSVIARGCGLQLTFLYKGRRRKETLPVSLTATNIKRAIDTLAAIRRDISLTGEFDYQHYFPAGRNGKHYGSTNDQRTVIDALEAWLHTKSTRIEFSTLHDYAKSVNNILIPAFGHIRLRDLTPRDIQQWVDSKECKAKRIRNILCPFRQMLQDAYRLGDISENPLDRVRVEDKIEAGEIDPESDDEALEETNADPFSIDEIWAILDGCQLEPQFRNLVLFAIWTGLRTSELIALRWRHIDWTKGVVKVRIAKVLNRFKRPKTKAGIRDVKLLPPAIEALKAQFHITGKANQEIFHNPRTGQPWTGDKQIRESYWRPLLRAVDVRYRRPYQLRHTYASMMLSARENPMWVAQQMGHEDWAMIRRVYGRWIPDFEKEAGLYALAVWNHAPPHSI